MDKLLGSKLDEVRRNISHQKKMVAEAVDRLMKVTNVQDQIVEQRQIKQDTEHRLNFYKEHGVEEKLQKRLDFDSDVRVMNKGIQLAANFVSDMESLLAQHEDDLRNFRGYQSKHNDELFKKFYQQYESYISFIETIKSWLTSEKTTKQALLASQSELSEIRKGMVEEFADIERKLAEELKGSGCQNISSDEFLSLKNKLTTATQMISVLKKQGNQKKNLQDQLLGELQKLNDLWLQEFNLIKDELDKVGTGSSSISISSGYKEDKVAFLSFMKDMFKGSGIRETTYQGIAEQYVDFVAIYKDLDNAKQLFGSNPQTLTDLFFEEP